jgi:menaquinone-9 beta-reductase
LRRVPLLIAGGGPAGAAAAIMLAGAGQHPELIERTEGAHDVVCGGFLGWDALTALRKLGIDPAALGARPIRRLRLAGRRHAFERALPQAAAGLSRRTLDEALLARAAAAGAEVRRGIAIRSVEGGLVRTGDEEIQAEALFLATGKHELRGAARSLVGARKDLAVGLRTSFALAAAAAAAADLDGVIELHPFDGGYAGLLLQEDGRVNLCMSVASARLRQAGGIAPLMAALAAEAPLLGARLPEAGEEPWLSISNVPYGWRARTGERGIYRLGDQAAVIASLAGDGIAIALASGMAAARAYLAGQSGVDYQRGFAARAGRPLAVAQALRWAAEHRGSRGIMLGLARAAPGLARMAARLTRIDA